MTNRIAGLSGNKRIILGVTSESELSRSRFGQIACMSVDHVGGIFTTQHRNRFHRRVPRSWR
jgi:hypothetical protein